jgi:mannose-6-phosphate isomerase-like protein (cupin superfamily)
MLASPIRASRPNDVRRCVVASTLPGLIPHDIGESTMREKINLSEKPATFSDYWSPRTIAQLNEYDVMVVKVKDEFVWHKHDETDDFFLVIKGTLDIQLRDRTITLGPGEMYIVPKGVEHRAGRQGGGPPAPDRAERHAERGRQASGGAETNRIASADGKKPCPLLVLLSLPRSSPPPLPRPDRSANDIFEAPVAQLDRALPSEGRGHKFESCRARQICTTARRLSLNYDRARR